MILRKPYAFLIKHFKRVHLVISILLIFMISRTYKLFSFLSSSSNVIPDTFKTSSYINFLIYIVIVLIILLIVALIVLMKKKEKPVLMYIITMIVYICVFVGYIFVEQILLSAEDNILEQQTILMARDISTFMMIGQIIFLVPFIIRTLGFDIKKFDFKRDMQELDIDVHDNEEFELNIEIDSNKVEQVSRRKLRELKYYYQENRLFIIIFSSVILFFILIKLITTISLNINLKYKENDVIKLDNFYTLSINDSIITTKDDTGKEINTDDSFFLIIKFTVKSNYQSPFTLDSDKFLLRVKGITYKPDKKYYNYFTNYGVGYRNQSIKFNDNKEYIFVYLIPNKYKNKKMQLEYHYRYDENEKMIKKIVKLKPEEDK